MQFLISLGPKFVGSWRLSYSRGGATSYAKWLRATSGGKLRWVFSASWALNASDRVLAARPNLVWKAINRWHRKDIYSKQLFYMQKPLPEPSYWVSGSWFLFNQTLLEEVKIIANYLVWPKTTIEAPETTLTLAGDSSLDLYQIEYYSVWFVSKCPMFCKSYI